MKSQRPAVLRGVWGKCTHISLFVPGYSLPGQSRIKEYLEGEKQSQKRWKDRKGQCVLTTERREALAWGHCVGMPGRWTSPRTRVLPPPQWVPAATLDSLLEESSWRRYNKPSQPVLWLLPDNGWVSSLQRSQGRWKDTRPTRFLGP